MTKNLYCVVGESGAGKDVLINYMCVSVMAIQK